jgi:hypothetical protein
MVLAATQPMHKYIQGIPREVPCRHFPMGTVVNQLLQSSYPTLVIVLTMSLIVRKFSSLIASWPIST